MRSKRSLIRLNLILFVVCLVSSCVTSRQELYHDPNADRASINISKIAIAPNRLPINLTNPEKWRRHNWRTASDFLIKRGYQVVDYNTTVNAFDRSGLRIEDTQISRNKYAELAEELSVDVILIPYYGTFTSAKPFLFANYLSWNSIATFQFYFADNTEFVTRIDMSGSSSYLQGILTIIAFGVTFIEPTAGLITMGVGTVADLSQTVFRSNDSHWGSAFNSAIRKGLGAFVNTYPPTSSGSVTKVKASKEKIPTHSLDEKFTINDSDIRSKVLKIKSNTVLLNTGSQKGVASGDDCFIVKKSGGEGDFSLIQKGEIVRVRDDAAVARFSDTALIRVGTTVLIRKQ